MIETPFEEARCTHAGCDEADRFCRHCGASLTVPISCGTLLSNGRGSLVTATSSPWCRPTGLWDARLTKLGIFLLVCAVCVAMVRADEGGVKSKPRGNETDHDETTDDQHVLRQLDEIIEKERNRQARMDLEDSYLADNGPKEISIFCPTAEVKIADLSPAAVMENECMVLDITAPELSTRLVLRCDGEFAGSGFSL